MGSDTAADYQAALQSVLYSNNNILTPAHSRTLVFAVTNGMTSNVATLD